MRLQSIGSADERVREMGVRIPRYLQETNVPGLSLALVRDGAIAAQLAFGMRDKARAAPVDPETVFQGASLSKPIFATAVLRLWEEGRLDLDVPLRDYLPAPYEPQNPQTSVLSSPNLLHQAFVYEAGR